MLDSAKPPMCHCGDTMCQIKNQGRINAFLTGGGQISLGGVHWCGEGGSILVESECMPPPGKF